jgi:hypothetical protein
MRGVPQPIDRENPATSIGFGMAFAMDFLCHAKIAFMIGMSA